MENLKLDLELDLGVDMQIAMTAWDENYPIPTIDNPKDLSKKIPAFASRKEHIEDILLGEFLRKLNYALDQYAKKDKLILTKTIFVKGE